MIWGYSGEDAGLMLFTAALVRFNLLFRPESHILELGCAETDWLERMHAADPSFVLTGVDVRAHERIVPGFVPAFDVKVGNGCDAGLFEPNSLDWVVMIGALEHFGLGFYTDPKDDDGDIHTMENVTRWLKPGGFCYFDVPCQPSFSIVGNRHYRMYGPRDIGPRLIPYGLQEINRGYSLPEPNAGMWCEQPTAERVPYSYVAVLAQKVA